MSGDKMVKFSPEEIIIASIKAGAKHFDDIVKINKVLSAKKMSVATVDDLIRAYKVMLGLGVIVEEGDGLRLNEKALYGPIVEVTDMLGEKIKKLVDVVPAFGE